MNRLRKTTLVAFAAVMAACSAARAQNVAPVASEFTVGASAPVERAALDLAAASSSGASTMFAAAAQSTITTQAAPAVNRQPASTRPLSSVGLGVTFGLGGVGFQVATPLIPGWMNLRGGASFFSYSGATFTANSFNVDAALKFQNAAIVVDVFPFHGRFRLSGGMTTYNNTAMTGSLNLPPGQSSKVGNDTYYSSPTDPLHGTGSLTFGGRTAGRASIGTGNMVPRKGHFAFETEIGVQFFTSPTAVFSIQGTGCTSPTDPTSCGPVQQSDVTAQQNELQNDLTDLKYYPIVSFGFSYKIH